MIPCLGSNPDVEKKKLDGHLIESTRSCDRKLQGQGHQLKPSSSDFNDFFSKAINSSRHVIICTRKREG